MDILRRKIDRQLCAWKESKNRNPLVVKGCRQCGKTFSVLHFAKTYYEHVVYLNFFENPDLKSIFDGRLDIDYIIMMITSIVPGSKLEAGKTCIVLDEIQECPNARTALKFFKMDGRFDVISTGSLLGVSNYREDAVSIPVGYETVMEMTPLDFEEFLWANGINQEVRILLEQSLDSAFPVPAPLHNRMRQLLLQYVVVGGMPAVVNEFLYSHDMDAVIRMQRDIVRSYRDDMVKYADKADKSKIRECFDSIPTQLSKENKKFQYSVIKKGSTAKKFEGSLKWIEDAGIIRRCNNLTITEFPFSGNAIREEFKIYMADIGLLISMLDEGTQSDILRGSLMGYKGAIFENLLADIFGKSGRKLYYFRKDTGLEIDFIIRYKGECTLVECKATSGNTKSSKTVLAHPDKYHVESLLKFGDYNVGRVGGITTLPLYMAFLIDSY